MNLANIVGPQHYNMRSAQVALYAIYAALALSFCLVIWLFLRVGVQWKACITAQHDIDREHQSVKSVADIVADARAGTNSSVFGGWLRGIPDLAARLERKAKLSGVTLQSVTPESGETDVNTEQAPSDETPVRAQRTRIRARGAYSSAIAWLRWLSTSQMPLKLEAITLSPDISPQGDTELAMDFTITLYSPKAPEKS